MCVTLRPTVICFWGDPQRQYRRFQFQETQVGFFIGAHNETFSVAMRIDNPDSSPLTINS
jgi:hypothetical protein